MMAYVVLFSCSPMLICYLLARPQIGLSAADDILAACWYSRRLSVCNNKSSSLIFATTDNTVSVT